VQQVNYLSSSLVSKCVLRLRYLEETLTHGISYRPPMRLDVIFRWPVSQRASPPRDGTRLTGWTPNPICVRFTIPTSSSIPIDIIETLKTKLLHSQPLLFVYVE